MTNSDQGNAVMREFRRRIQRAYEWDSVGRPAPRGYDPPLELEEIELAVEVLQQYVGEYQLEDDITLAITLEDGTLLAGAVGRPPAPLFAAEMDHFFFRRAPVEIFFARDADGDVIGITVVQGAERQDAPKVR